MNKPTVLFGPEPSKNPLNSGSWKWFGIDLANELSKYYNIIFQKTRDDVKKADCYVVIKSLEFLKKLGDKRKRIYLPVDKLRHATEVKFILDNLPTHTILNNEELRKNIFWNKIYPTSYIPHHIKYFYDGYGYREQASIFWEGMFGNYKYVKEFLEQAIVPKDMKFLISGKERDPNKEWYFLDFVQNFKHRIHFAWSEEKHKNFLLTCSGFLDIKGNDFHQRYKPATKVLDALASGVPTAINDCGVRRYMESLGIELAYPTDTEKWFSLDYYDYTQGLKWRIREEFNVEKIALQYKEVIDQVLSNV